MELLPEQGRPTQANSELEKRARQVGSIAGSAVALVRNARRRLEDSRGDLGSNVKGKVEEFRGTASIRADEWRRSAQRRAAELGRQVKFRLEDARVRAHRFGRDYPWHLVLAAGILGFVLGATLRIRRAHRGL